MSIKTIMVMAGGTGGHVYPAIAVADYLKQHGWNVVWLATEQGMENRLIEGKGYQKATIKMQGVRGKGMMSWIMVPLKLLRACHQSLQALKTFKPHVVLGMGGFAAFPGALMSKICGIPLVIHEQNSLAGLTNKLMAKLANRTLVAFPNALPKGELVGNPVRDNITQLPIPARRFSDRQGPLRVLVIGGSLGAQAFNELIPQAMALLPQNKRPMIVHQSGVKHLDALMRNYQMHGVKADCRAFIEDMDELYAWADFVIARAGAMTVAELAVVGLGSLLIPYPYAVDDHQTFNARYLSSHGAAKLISQKELSPEMLKDLMNSLSRETCLDMANLARKLGQPEATLTVATVCSEVAK
jgi:UDP-N-acetylglucosamine--N-acetylmuramyl-(pentapeptide) pyrophosphoryl-undecaprenol N-acetylglucosamine transferase